MQHSPDRVVGERGQCSMSNNGSNGGFSTIAEEKSPLVQLTKETIISLDYVSYFLIDIASVLTTTTPGNVHPNISSEEGHQPEGLEGQPGGRARRG